MRSEVRWCLGASMISLDVPPMKEDVPFSYCFIPEWIPAASFAAAGNWVYERRSPILYWHKFSDKWFYSIICLKKITYGMGQITDFNITNQEVTVSPSPCGLWRHYFALSDLKRTAQDPYLQRTAVGSRSVAISSQSKMWLCQFIVKFGKTVFNQISKVNLLLILPSRLNWLYLPIYKANTYPTGAK